MDSRVLQVKYNVICNIKACDGSDWFSAEGSLYLSRASVSFLPLDRHCSLNSLVFYLSVIHGCKFNKALFGSASAITFQLADSGLPLSKVTFSFKAGGEGMDFASGLLKTLANRISASDGDNSDTRSLDADMPRFDEPPVVPKYDWAFIDPEDDRVLYLPLNSGQHEEDFCAREATYSTACSANNQGHDGSGGPLESIRSLYSRFLQIH